METTNQVAQKLQAIKIITQYIDCEDHPNRANAGRILELFEDALGIDEAKIIEKLIAWDALPDERIDDRTDVSKSVSTWQCIGSSPEEWEFWYSHQECKTAHCSQAKVTKGHSDDRWAVSASTIHGIPRPAYYGEESTQELAMKAAEAYLKKELDDDPGYHT